jgi:hypothetical protein
MAYQVDFLGPDADGAENEERSGPRSAVAARVVQGWRIRSIPR